MRSITWMAGDCAELSFFVMVTGLSISSYFCMAKLRRACRGLIPALLMTWAMGPCGAAEPPAAASATAATPAPGASDAAEPAPPRRWLRVPRVLGRITAEEIGLVINTADPYSVEVGEHYRRVRQIPEDHVLRVELPVQPRLAPADLERLRRRIDAHFRDEVQALALAWVKPYAVECQSITSAVTLGFEAQACQQVCGRRAVSPYFNAATASPWRRHGLRPSMLLAASDAERARRLIDRGAASDGTLGLRGAAPVHVHFMSTGDVARSVRGPLFPPPGLVSRLGVEVRLGEGEVLPRGAERVLLLQTGAAQLPGLDTVGWVPGALADHLTSFGGVLDRSAGQATVLEWIDAGAVASYGTVSEPCNHLQKFPHPQLLLLHYLQGATAIEAYWKSVAWPQQGVFVGEPLAAPFARP
ncbi:MAG: hypothetical protein RL456_1590 [Pseudomonadota bacterium]